MKKLTMLSVIELWLVNNELKRKLNLICCTGIWVQELRNRVKNFNEDDITTEMRTLRLLNTSHKYSRLKQLPFYWKKKVLSPSYTMKAYGGSRGTAPRILSSGISFRWLVNFMIWPPYPTGKNSGTHCIGDWVGPREGFDVLENGQIPYPSWDLKPGPSASTEPFFLPSYNPELFFNISVFLKWRDFRLPLCCEVLDLGVNATYVGNIASTFGTACRSHFQGWSSARRMLKPWKWDR